MDLKQLLDIGAIPIIDPLVLEQSPDDFLAQYGGHLDTLAIIAKGEAGYLYYESASSPSDPRYKEYFSSLARIADNIGIKVYAIVNAHLDGYLGRNPEFQTVKSGGTPVDGFVCPSQESFVLYQSEIIRELVETFPIQGIVVKNNMFVHRNFCFNDKCRREFASIMGMDRDFGIESLMRDRGRFETWLNWRVSKVNQLATELTQTAKRSRNVDVILDVYADPSTSYFDGSRINFGQDLHQLARISGHVSIHFSPWTNLPGSSTDERYQAAIQQLETLRSLDMANVKHSLYLWGTDDLPNTDVITDLKRDTNSAEVFVQPKYPLTYRASRELHLALGV